MHAKIVLQRSGCRKKRNKLYIRLSGEMIFCRGNYAYWSTIICHYYLHNLKMYATRYGHCNRECDAQQKALLHLGVYCVQLQCSSIFTPAQQQQNHYSVVKVNYLEEFSIIMLTKEKNTLYTVVMPHLMHSYIELSTTITEV